MNIILAVILSLFLASGVVFILLGIYYLINLIPSDIWNKKSDYDGW